MPLALTESDARLLRRMADDWRRNRGRLPPPAPPPQMLQVGETIAFQAAAGQTIPQYGVFTNSLYIDPAYPLDPYIAWNQPAATDGYWAMPDDSTPMLGGYPNVINAGRSDSLASAMAFIAQNSYVNAGTDVAAGLTGQCSRALHKPVWALANAVETGDSYTFPQYWPEGQWGLLPGANDFKLYPGLPGFRALGAFLDDPPRILVLSDEGQIALQVKATCDWSPGPEIVVAQVQFQGAAYDGTLAGVNLSIDIALPTTGASGSRGQDPAVFLNDLFFIKLQREIDGFGFFMPIGNYLDDCIGTVKMWSNAPAIANSIPNGWRPYAAMEGAFPAGYLSGDTNFGSLGGTGGAITHTHSVAGPGGNLGTATYLLHAATHLPPYCTIQFIERYK